MATHAELVARLTLAIDHDDDDDDSTPRVEGNANGPDKAVAERILEELLRYAPVAPPATTPRSSTAGGTTPAERIAQAYDAWDRAVRAMMTMILERCWRYHDAATDPRGNPIAPELRGQPVDAGIRAFDPDSPTPEIPVEVSACWSACARWALDHDIDQSVVEALRRCAEEYDSARWAQLRPIMSVVPVVLAASTREPLSIPAPRQPLRRSSSTWTRSRREGSPASRHGPLQAMPVRAVHVGCIDRGSGRYRRWWLPPLGRSENSC